MSADSKLVTVRMDNTLEEKCAYEWTISNLFNMKTPVQIPIYTNLKNADVKFCFEIWFQMMNRDLTTEMSSLQVILRKQYAFSVYQDLQFLLLAYVYYSDGSLCLKYNTGNSIALADFTVLTCVNKIYSRNSNAIHFQKLKEKDELVFKCRMFFSGHLITSKAYHDRMDTLQDLQNCMENFEALYQSNEFSDVSIQIGGTIIKSHKFVLAAHSPVFKRMLLQDFQETKTCVITLSDVEPETFKSFLKFLYTCEMEDKSFINFKQLFSLADKYDVQILKQKYYKILTDCSLNENQIDEVLQMAYQYNDENLKKVAKRLIVLTHKI